jgi:hypothetical protein
MGNGDEGEQEGIGPAKHSGTVREKRKEEIKIEKKTNLKTTLGAQSEELRGNWRRFGGSHCSGATSLLGI